MYLKLGCLRTEIRDFKNIVLLLSLAVVTNMFSQNTNNFKPGVEIIALNKAEDFKTPKSILFVFEGDTHLIYYYLNLKKEIIKATRRRGRKAFKSIKLDFNYEMDSKSPLESDLSRIPLKKFDKKLYDMVCHVSLSNYFGWDNHLIKKRKQNYFLCFVVESPTSKGTVFNLKLEVNSHYTIATENKNSSIIFVNQMFPNL